MCSTVDSWQYSLKVYGHSVLFPAISIMEYFHAKENIQTFYIDLGMTPSHLCQCSAPKCYRFPFESVLLPVLFLCITLQCSTSVLLLWLYCPLACMHFCPIPHIFSYLSCLSISQSSDNRFREIVHHDNNKSLYAFNVCWSRRVSLLGPYQGPLYVS